MDTNMDNSNMNNNFARKKMRFSKSYRNKDNITSNNNQPLNTQPHVILKPRPLEKITTALYSRVNQPLTTNNLSLHDKNMDQSPVQILPTVDNMNIAIPTKNDSNDMNNTNAVKHNDNDMNDTTTVTHDGSINDVNNIKPPNHNLFKTRVKHPPTLPDNKTNLIEIVGKDGTVINHPIEPLNNKNLKQKLNNITNMVL